MQKRVWIKIDVAADGFFSEVKVSFLWSHSHFKHSAQFSIIVCEHCVCRCEQINKNKIGPIGTCAKMVRNDAWNLMWTFIMTMSIIVTTQNYSKQQNKSNVCGISFKICAFNYLRFFSMIDILAPQMLVWPHFANGSFLSRTQQQNI